MPCLLALLSLFFPRVVMAVIFFATSWFPQAYANTFWLWPVLGFIFMPYTTLAYMAAMIGNNHQVNGGWLVVLIVAVLVDLGGQGRSIRGRRRRKVFVHVVDNK
jgi:hypothetical protein